MNTLASTQNRTPRVLEVIASILMAIVTFITLPFRKIGQMKLVLGLTLIVAIAALALAYEYLIEFSSFAAKPMTAAIGCALFYLVDRYGFNEVDTISHLKEDGNAYTAHLRSYALIIAGSMVSF